MRTATTAAATRPGARPGRRPALGVSLIEALVALLVMSLGMLALVGVQTNLRVNAEVARQRAEATRIASEELERLRFFNTIEPVGGQVNPSYSEIAGRKVDSYMLPDATNTTTYTVARKVTTQRKPDRLVVEVTVSWQDRADVTQTVNLDTVIAGTDPTLGAMLMTPLSTPPFSRNQGRHPSIPPGAVDVDAGRSAFQPPNSGGVVWVFNSSTGVIVSVCTGVYKEAATITADDLKTCTSVTGQLLQGWVRFNQRLGLVSVNTGYKAYKPVPTGTVAWVFNDSTGQLVNVCTVPTSALRAGDKLPNPDCESVAAKPVLPYNAADACNGAKDCSGSTLVTGDATNPSWPALNLQVGIVATDPPLVDPSTSMCFDDAPTSADAAAKTSVLSRPVQYFCLVQSTNLNKTTGWGGQVNITGLKFSDAGSSAWTIKGDEPEYKVCRYTTATTDLTSNTNHPRTYCLTAATDTLANACKSTRVNGNLNNQNFLVIAGKKSCPPGTLQHQP